MWIRLRGCLNERTPSQSHTLKSYWASFTHAEDEARLSAPPPRDPPPGSCQSTLTWEKERDSQNMPKKRNFHAFVETHRTPFTKPVLEVWRAVTRCRRLLLHFQCCGYAPYGGSSSRISAWIMALTPNRGLLDASPLLPRCGLSLELDPRHKHAYRSFFCHFLWLEDCWLTKPDRQQ